MCPESASKNQHGRVLTLGEKIRRSTLLRFGLVGALGFVVDAAVLYAFSGAVGWYGARVLSFLAAASFTWALNRRFTFATANGCRLRRPSIWQEYMQYLFSMMAGGLVNYAAYSMVIASWQGTWVPLWGVAAGSILGLVVNYALARYLVFRTKP
ncbi:Putative flippase GtrA (transmembrane translocase of bactoprenol-linked glucose) [Lampropedia hyalina DSM 16112]|jgi:putative flippase GtrA|uniref:Putative flippase GtrA (Transmembrane translocase of bactoprenol-linked glucose) n=1 Tax=Lampropedia hyalina DSM 16112 TaxID=1122156 RepID=A0A1M4XR46_9BURK|nr:GtrA family protein [Lampropedia hyalina]SHE95959.1 Putative flippase GtrA (transmembrane translocase of bactoprenol-linked glucose) [Lampropedia hyalina DSM 16112]